MVVADLVRAEKQRIADRWEARVLAELPELHAYSRAELVDHMPEFLEGLAGWVDGRREEASEAFAALAKGHAMQRHSTGVELQTLTAEYAALRRVILETLVERAPAEELARAIVAVEGGIDCAVNGAVHLYAQARDRVRERFIGILAHDLRDPLGAISMSATMLDELVTGDKAAQLVDRIHRGAKRIEGMIDDVLDFARGRLSGGIPTSPQLADMGEICAAAVDETRAVQANNAVDLEPRGDLRGFWDPDRVRQALANLLANARHHGKGAKVLLRVWEREDRRAVLTSVTNFGPTIPTELVARIFDPFARENQRGRGLGLGLYIVQQIALAHGGRCSVTSSLEEGTTFTIEWPRTPVEETPGRPTE